MREEVILAKDATLEENKIDNILSSGKCIIPANQLKLVKSFTQYMDENKNLRDMIETGKGNLQWERDIPAAALVNLQEPAKADFRGNLGEIIHDLYQTAHIMFSDMPQGDHKKRAKYRFPSKTLMLLLYPWTCMMSLASVREARTS